MNQKNEVFMKAHPSIAFDSFSGSAGEVTARHSKNGTILSSRAQHDKVSTPAQKAERAILARIVRSIEAISHYGDVEWDNNLLERINRYISLSRHNSLFFGSHEGAKRGCVFYSLACSCRCNGINFFDYLSDVLNKAADLPHLTPEACRELLPDKWTKG